ncbi:MAG: hypothetical protein ABI945_09500 [Nitrospirales bacterium]
MFSNSSEAGCTVAELSREYAVSGAMLYAWQAKNGGLTVDCAAGEGKSAPKAFGRGFECG